MKLPCVDCERHRFYKKELFDENPLTQHYCITKRRNRVTGDYIERGCWWYRRTPFCKFEPKEGNHE